MNSDLIDWQSTGTMLQGIGAILLGVGTLAGAVAVLVAALIGRASFASWKRQKLTERRMGLAENILEAIYSAKICIRYMRSPFMPAEELAEAERDLRNRDDIQFAAMDDQRQRSITQAQAYLNRVAAHQEVWDKLEEVRPLATAYFGEKVSDEIQEIIRQVASYQNSAKVLPYVQSGHGSNDGPYSNLSWGRLKEERDELGEKVKKAIAEVEKILMPLLREDIEDVALQ